MANRTKESARGQVQSELQDLESAKGLPFRELLNEERILTALEAEKVTFRDRIFNPMVTLWAFLSQVIARKNSSCKDAVSRVLVDRVVRGEKACSSDTNSYCRARGRLPESLLANLTREIGRELDRLALPEWLCNERHVKIVDGSTATMADTLANQEAYPQSRGQKVGLGFPILRFVVILSLSVGTVLECVYGACRGKKTGEQSLFRETWNALESRDILLGDRLFDAYRDIALLRSRSIDVVFGKKQSRRCDFRRGRKLGPNDHVVVWTKPKYDASRYENKEEWKSLPDEMEMREIRTTVRRAGYRTRKVVIVTTLLDPQQYPAKDLTDLFAQRWHCELDLRSIKQALGMCHLHCKTPAMVRKELWAHLLAYNLIRVRMAQAAAVHGAMPRRLSFSDAKILIHNFAPHLANASRREHHRLEAELLEAIARCKLTKRPGRKEPRAVKKRQQKYSYLTQPRHQARKRLAA